MRLRKFKYSTSTDLSRAMTQPVLRSAPPQRPTLQRNVANYLRDPMSGQRNMGLEVAAAGANKQVFDTLSKGMLDLHNLLASTEAEVSATNALYAHKMKGIEVVADLKAQALSSTITTTDTLGVTHEVEAPTYTSVVGNFTTSITNHRKELAATLPRAVRNSFNNAAIGVDIALAKEASKIQIQKQIEWINFQGESAFQNAKTFADVDVIAMNPALHTAMGGDVVARKAYDRKNQIALDSMGAHINAAWSSEIKLNKITSMFGYPAHVFEGDWRPGSEKYFQQDAEHGLNMDTDHGMRRAWAIFNTMKVYPGDLEGQYVREVLSNLKPESIAALRAKIKTRFADLKKVNEDYTTNKVNARVLLIATARDDQLADIVASQRDWVWFNPGITPAQINMMTAAIKLRNQGPIFDDQEDYVKIAGAIEDFTVFEIIAETGLTWSTRVALMEKRVTLEAGGQLWSSSGNSWGSQGYQAVQKLKRMHQVLDVTERPGSLRYYPQAAKKEKLEKLKKYNEDFDELETHLRTIIPENRPMAARKWVDDLAERNKTSSVTSPIPEKGNVGGYPISSDPDVNRDTFNKYVIDMSDGTLDLDAVLKLPKGKLRERYVNAATAFGVELSYPGSEEDDYTLGQWLERKMGTIDEWFTVWKARMRLED